MPFCKKCGAQVPPNARFCRGCGQPVVLPQAAQTPPKPAPVKPNPQPQPAPVAPTPQPQPAPAAPTPQPQPAPVAPRPTQEFPNFPEDNIQARPQKKGSKLPLIIALVVLLLGGIGACLWFFVFDKKDETKPAEAAQTTVVDDKPAKTEAPVATATVKEEAPAPVQEEAPAEPAPVEVESKPAQSPFSTTDVPKDADFKNWYIGNAQTKGKPKGANSIADFSAITGSWKVLFFQDPKNKYGVKAYTYANVTIDGSAEKLTYSIKRHSTRFLTTNETVKETDVDDVFNGKWKSGKLTASGAGSLTISAFWQQNGKQYATGTFDSPDGMPVSIGMVRP